jgi:2-aminoadipate transaminase
MKRSAVREILKVTANPEIISFAGGLPAAELFPVARVKEALGAVLDRVGGKSLQYSESEGLAGLRDWIASQFTTAELRVERDNVLITSGGQQALDLVGRVLLEPGDRVIVENPTYLALLSAWRPQGVEFLAAPSDDDGMQVEAIEPLLKQRPKLIYLSPNFQNPQGTTLGEARRHRLAALLREYDVGLVEDNPYGELRYTGQPLPHLLQLDAAAQPASGPGNHVIYVGTFSKVLMPGLRLGWAIAAREVIDKLVQAKQAADLHTSTLNQHLALELLSQGFLEKFLPLLRQTYRQRRDRMLTALEKHFPKPVSWTHPDGGMFLLARLAKGQDAGALLPAALARKVAFVPGEEFHLNGDGRNTLRLNFSNTQPEQIEIGIRCLAEALAPGPA